MFDSRATGSDDGTGLGLHIVQNLVAAHGWSVRAIEGAAGGARFEFDVLDAID